MRSLIVLIPSLVTSEKLRPSRQTLLQVSVGLAICFEFHCDGKITLRVGLLLCETGSTVMAFGPAAELVVTDFIRSLARVVLGLVPELVPGTEKLWSVYRLAALSMSWPRIVVAFRGLATIFFPACAKPSGEMGKGNEIE